MPENLQNTEPVIRIRSLYKQFDDATVLKGIDLDVYRGENLVVLGRSGTGKSVLIKILTGLLQPTSGEVTVLGKDVANLGKRELDALRLKIGFSFQNSALYDSMSVRENLEFPLAMHRAHLTASEITERAKDALDAVGLLSKLDSMPADLSGGQKKRVGIARTLIMNPEIMLYDEPTAGLDPITSTEINELINKVQERFKTTSIIITHDLTCAKVTGDRVAMLMDGKFIGIGSFDEVFAMTDDRIQRFYRYNFIH